MEPSDCEANLFLASERALSDILTLFPEAVVNPKHAESNISCLSTLSLSPDDCTAAMFSFESPIVSQVTSSSDTVLYPSITGFSVLFLVDSSEVFTANVFFAFSSASLEIFTLIPAAVANPENPRFSEFSLIDFSLAFIAKVFFALSSASLEISTLVPAAVANPTKFPIS